MSSVSAGRRRHNAAASRSSGMLREEREDLRLMRTNHAAMIAARDFDVLVGLHRDRLHRLRPCASDGDRHDGVHIPVDQHDWHFRGLAEVSLLKIPFSLRRLMLPSPEDTYSAMSVLRSLVRTLRVSLRSRAALQLEILALRHQLHVLERCARPGCRSADLTGCSGCCCLESGRGGVTPSSSSNQKPSSAGTGSSSGALGPRRAGTSADRRCRPTFAP